MTPQPLYTRERDPAHTVQEDGGGAEERSGLERKISPSSWIRTPNRPAPSESVYRLRNPFMLSLCDYHEIRQKRTTVLHPLTRNRI